MIKELETSKLDVVRVRGNNVTEIRLPFTISREAIDGKIPTKLWIAFWGTLASFFAWVALIAIIFSAVGIDMSEGSAGYAWAMGLFLLGAIVTYGILKVLYDNMDREQEYSRRDAAWAVADKELAAWFAEQGFEGTKEMAYNLLVRDPKRKIVYFSSTEENVWDARFIEFAAYGKGKQTQTLNIWR